ncbi:histamine H2 receptor [Nasonia vitripennis]|uniref:G-protein coupled receptors family 1 profile domain-containing protein n=1 Tax=Nasonia vitripennis TaxID=7425 RepID=A0A7M7J8Z2_NASVI|nr:histamine H2 receptor [Nasonia vitripennis]
MDTSIVISETSTRDDATGSLAAAPFPDRNISDFRTHGPPPSCCMCWVVADVVVLIVILLGNILTILAVRLSRRLRNVTSNQLILSLAISDLVVGVAVLYHLFFFVNRFLSANKATCLLRFALLACGCCASFGNVTAIAIDRYLAIVHPLKYPEYVTDKVVYGTIGFVWSCAIFISTMPTYWNNYDVNNGCELGTVVPRYFTVAILTPMFLTVWLSIFLLYWRIWKEAKTHAQRWKRNGFLNFDSSHWKSIQVVLLILGCFSICWLPYVVVAFTQVINARKQPSPTLYRVMFSIAMSNSGINPIIYAWKNPSFRRAFQRLLRLRSPDHNDYNSSFKNYLRKQSELSRRELELEARNELGPAFVCKAAEENATIGRIGEVTVL